MRKWYMTIKMKPVINLLDNVLKGETYHRAILKYEAETVKLYRQKDRDASYELIPFMHAEQVVDILNTMYQRHRGKHHWKRIFIVMNREESPSVEFDFADWTIADYTDEQVCDYYQSKYTNRKVDMDNTLYESMHIFESKKNRNRFYIENILYKENWLLKILASILLIYLNKVSIPILLNVFVLNNGMYWLAIFTLGLSAVMYFIPAIGVLNVLLPRMMKGTFAKWFYMLVMIITVIYAYKLFNFVDIASLEHDPNAFTMTLEEKNKAAAFLLMNALIQWWFIEFDIVSRKFKVMR